HTEAFALDFDPRVITYDDLLAQFWAAHDPARPAYRRQYMAAIFPSAQQHAAAIASRDRIAATLGDRTVETAILPDARFYFAEDYHQKYHLRHDATLMAELAHYAPRAFVDSTVAARLNGFAAGHGSIAQLEAELDLMQLSPAAVKSIRARFGRRATAS
ncbi:MAG TPA: peptide-methionine (S)-S-oxide reductase, partial [Kofleriaceae bacterium]|nr:peptide-methionine (S)-S-oxide reductase [Kofleriaceae bacterium]